MKRFLCLLCVAGALFVSSEAHAQFANRSFTAEVGYLSLDQVSGVLDWGIPIGLGYSGYIDSGFEWTVTALPMILWTHQVGGDINNIFGLAGGPGLRYLFLEESLRPYAGVELTYLHLFFPSDSGYEQNFVGLGPNVGIEYFVGDTASIGLKAQFNVYATLTNKIEFQTAKGIFLTGGAYF